MAAKDLTKKTEKELLSSVEKLRSTIDQSRRDLLQNKTEAVKTIRHSKKELARTLTVINSKRKER